MSLLRGHSNDAPLAEWLEDIRAFELRMTYDDIRAGLALALVEMIRAGTVGFVDMHLWDAALLGLVVQSGMRVRAAPAIFGSDTVGYPLASPETGAQVLDGTAALASEFAGEARIRISYGPHAFYTAGVDLMREVAERARVDGLGIHTHLSETRAEVDDCLAQFGRSPIGLAADVGILGATTHVAHAVHPRPGDLGLLAGSRATVSHNPISNLKLGAGIAPVREYSGGGIRLALGTDSMASNNSADLFEEIKLGALLQRGLRENPTGWSATDTLRMATEGGAAALDEGLSGRLAVGAAADFVLVDATAVAATPLADAVSFLGYAARGSDVTDTVIGGRRVLAAGRVTTLDEDAILSDARERTARIRRELDRSELDR
jgi:5-methylthioadenosine/S-adenosylhomocysteine deaminase